MSPHQMLFELMHEANELTTDSGLLICKIIEGSIAKTDTHLEILMDDMLYPSYTTSKIRNKQQKFEESKIL